MYGTPHPLSPLKPAANPHVRTGAANLRSTVRNPSVRSIFRPFGFFSILVSFLSFSDFKKKFQRKILEKNFFGERHKNFSKKKIGEIEKIDEKKLKKYLHLNKKKFGEKTFTT